MRHRPRRLVGPQAFGFADIEVQPVRSDDDELLLVLFADRAKRAKSAPTAKQRDLRRSPTERELKVTRTEPRAPSRPEVPARTEGNEEALSINEEYQSTNEPLTSKEELQSLT